jgi:uncharacterized protein DUF4115
VSRDEQGKPFDEKAALAELERLRESIQAARHARQRTSDEFAAFIRSFRNPPSTPTSDKTAPWRAWEEPQPAPSESIEASRYSRDSLPSTAPVPSSTDSVPERIALPASRVPRYRVDIRLVGILGIVAVIALALMLTRRGKETAPPRAVHAVRDSGASTQTAAASSPAPVQSAAATPTAHAVAIELRVIRPVWMRIVVDGRKDIEGTVQAGEPMHLTGDHTIVVRVGNGGDVVVRTGTRDEPFGETGQPRTRTFSKP